MLIRLSAQPPPARLPATGKFLGLQYAVAIPANGAIDPPGQWRWHLPKQSLDSFGKLWRYLRGPV